MLAIMTDVDDEVAVRLVFLKQLVGIDDRHHVIIERMERIDGC